MFLSNSGTRPDLERVVALWSEGRFSPMPLTIKPMEEIRQAHQLVEDRNFIGKIVITP
jgi:D-arabinose 1-dehydrogenase-like Zn-dependent alcohol dehydrogenase